MKWNDNWADTETSADVETIATWFNISALSNRTFEINFAYARFFYYAENDGGGFAASAETVREFVEERTTGIPRHAFGEQIAKSPFDGRVGFAGKNERGVNRNAEAGFVVRGQVRVEFIFNVVAKENPVRTRRVNEESEIEIAAVSDNNFVEFLFRHIAGNIQSEENYNCREQERADYDECFSHRKIFKVFPRRKQERKSQTENAERADTFSIK